MCISYTKDNVYFCTQSQNWYTYCQKPPPKNPNRHFRIDPPKTPLYHRQKPQQKLLKVYQKSAKNLLPYLHPKNLQCSFYFGVLNTIRDCYTESEILFPILGNMVRAFVNHIDKNPIIGVDHII